jgi:hypothetical protein
MIELVIFTSNMSFCSSGITDSLDQGRILPPGKYEIYMDEVCEHLLTRPERFKIQIKVSSESSEHVKISCNLSGFF